MKFRRLRGRACVTDGCMEIDGVSIPGEYASIKGNSVVVTDAFYEQVKKRLSPETRVSDTIVAKLFEFTPYNGADWSTWIYSPPNQYVVHGFLKAPAFVEVNNEDGVIIFAEDEDDRATIISSLKYSTKPERVISSRKYELIGNLKEVIEGKIKAHGIDNAESFFRERLPQYFNVWEGPEPEITKFQDLAQFIAAKENYEIGQMETFYLLRKL